MRLGYKLSKPKASMRDIQGKQPHRSRRRMQFHDLRESHYLTTARDHLRKHQERRRTFWYRDEDRIEYVTIATSHMHSIEDPTVHNELQDPRMSHYSPMLNQSAQKVAVLLPRKDDYPRLSCASHKSLKFFTTHSGNNASMRLSSRVNSHPSVSRCLANHPVFADLIQMEVGY